MTDPDRLLAKSRELMSELEGMYVRLAATNARLSIPAMKLAVQPTVEHLRATMGPLRELSDELIAAGSLVRRFVDLVEPELTDE